jgi:hypothetical protein
VKFWILPTVTCLALAAGAVFFVSHGVLRDGDDYQLTAAVAEAPTSTVSTAPLVSYTGTIYHVFFHSLIIYPELAYQAKDAAGYKKYMITVSQFKSILESLYQNNFVLIDIHAIYGVNPDGTVYKKNLLIPEGKKPLIVSLDDLNYYHTMKGDGFASKLVLDQSGRVATLVTAPDGTTAVTRDGDVVPILDDFVLKHPDFSVGGAKGVIAETGFEGVLGYRTESSSSIRAAEIAAVQPVIAALKQDGWQFASHSYTHQTAFLANTISLETLMADTQRWKAEVEPLVGSTDIFVGPFGQVFKDGDPRRAYLVSQGFKMLCGVGLDRYLNYFPTYVMMDRADIDGYRITHSNKNVEIYFDPTAL